MPARPPRVKLKSELGFSISLPEGDEYLELSGQGDNILITCPGPRPQLCQPYLAGKNRVFLLDAPEFSAQMPASWHAAISDAWQAVTREDAQRMISGVQVLHYTPASRIFPSLFGPLLARQKVFSSQPMCPEIWLPGSPSALIVPEVSRAAQALGLRPRLLAPNPHPEHIRELLQSGPPRLFLSINFHGLDPYGEIQSLLEAAGTRLAVWCVDNPFHLLTRQKNRLWQQAALFVTDAWFVKPLTEMGARAYFLPLATDPEIFAQTNTCPAGDDISFVGRSSFPQRDRFFAASSIPEELMAESETLAGRQAHFGWWHEKLGLPLWPGNDVRSIGLGAERSSQAWRMRCLRHLAEQAKLTIVGDNGWRENIPAARLLPPVDYYTKLAAVYRESSFSLNLTSLLLPHGLTQRHFDVWACGGFLLTDATSGLELFPPELTQSIAFETPEQAVRLLRRFAKDARLKEDLRRAWREHILAEHTYVQRLRQMLEIVESVPAV